MVANSLFFRVATVGLLGVSAASYADRALLPSAADLSAENRDVIVTHEHDLQFEGASTSIGDALSVDWKSTLRIISKTDGSEILNERVMPLTTLVNIDGGPYFAGLSQLKTLAFRYNFVLFTQEGRVITTALITSESGHCRSLSSTVTNFIRWYDETDSDVVELSVEHDGQVGDIIVKNPYDRTADEKSRVCVIPVEPPAPLDPFAATP